MKIFRQLMLSALMAGTGSPCALYAQQKPALELKDCNNWPTMMGQRKISANGDYVYYEVDNERPGVKMLHVRSIDGKWEKTFEKKQGSWMNAEFSGDGRKLIMQLPGGRVSLLTLGTDQLEELTEVTGFTPFTNNGTEYLALAGNGDRLTLRNMADGKTIVLQQVRQHEVSHDGNFIVLATADRGLKLYDLKAAREIAIWNGKGELQAMKFDRRERNLFFSVLEEGKLAFWWAVPGKAAVRLLDDASSGIGDGYTLENIESILADGESLLFTFRRNTVKADAVKLPATVNIYSYMDTVPYSQQKSSGLFSGQRLSFKGIYNLNARKVIYRESEHEMYATLANSAGDYGVVSYTFMAQATLKDRSERLLSTRTGEFVQPGGKDMRVADLNYPTSPNGRYIIYGSPEGPQRNLYSYDTKTGKMLPLTDKLPIPQRDTTFRGDYFARYFKILAWNEGSGKMLLRDQYDIWQIDPSGKDAPVNITNGYGRKHRIMFQLSCLNFMRGGIFLSPRQQSLIVLSYNYMNAASDLYRISLPAPASDPVRLTDGKYIYEHVDGFDGPIRGGSWSSKAARADIYLLCRLNASESPNLVTTKDFKTFTNVTNIYPEKKYNWLTTELMHFNAADGRPLKAVLHKPENFDPNKKYPVIFYFYEQLSQNLNRYYEPELSRAVINIPYYVSNGYIVCTPDMGVMYEGHAAQMALNSVLGAADELEKRPYIDGRKMAVHGHSWGGFECNYIAVNSNRFAAAVSNSGGTDPIGAYGLPTHGGYPNWGISYDNAGGNLMDSLNVFVRNSPKIYASKLTTPLLIMHNRGDNAVLFQHGESFFFYLWQLGKRAWLLDYDNEGHTIEKEANKLDFSIRMKQFFDHYLKDAPAPVWMTRGLPYLKKGLETGYDYDKQRATPILK